MNNSYLLQKLSELNGNIPNKFATAFQKPPHLSSKLIGERNIKSRIGSRVSFFPSIKNQGIICLESNLELAHAIELERDSDVLQYRTQAVKIFINDRHFLIPDFIVKKVNTYEVHEIKPNINTLSPKHILRFKAAEDILDKHSIKFKVFDQTTLPSKDDCLFLNMCYQRSHFLSIDHIQLVELEKIIATRMFKNREDLYNLFKSNNVNPFIVDYFIFYKKILGV